MPAGFMSITDSGSVQIDDQWKTFHFLSAPTVDISTNRGDGFDGFWAYLDVNGNDPLIALGNTSSQPVVVVQREPIGANLWRFWLQTPGPFGVFVKVYVFDWLSSPPAATNFGLQVFGPDGGLVFDSGTRVMHVTNVFQVVGTGSSFSIPQDGRTYAAGLTFSRLSLRVTSAGGGTGYSWVNDADGITVSSTLVQSSRDAIYAFDSASGDNLPTERPPQTTNPPQILLVDVTHL